MLRSIRGGCGASHPRGFRMSRPKGLEHWVVLIVRTRGEFQIGEERFSVTPPQAILIAPGTPYSYENPEGEYLDDWLHFEADEPLEARLAAMRNRPFPIGEAGLFTVCIQQLIWELSYGEEPYASANRDALAGVLLNRLCAAWEKRGAFGKNHPLEDRLRLLRLELESSVERRHDAASHARELGLSASHFQYLYRTLFGVPFRQDVIRMRVERAKSLLATRSLPLSRIAELCGYANEVHFYRQFRRATGMRPGAYRRSGGGGNDF